MRRTLGTAAGLLLVLVLSRLGEAGTPVDASTFEETVWCSSDQLSQATSMAWAPDGRLFILRQHGEIKTLRAGQVVATFATFGVGDGSGFAGALGICVDRNYASNKFVYVLATVANNDSQIIRWTANGDVGTNRTTILRGLPTRLIQHDGGGIEMGPDGKIYFGMGDLGTGLGVDGDLSSLGSKIGRCNPDGTAPIDNPYYNAADGITQKDYIWARGFRNAFTLTFRPSNGSLWVNDVGTNFEQVFLVNRGDHAGWDNYAGGNQPAGFIKPRISYATNGTTGVFAGAGCVSGGAFYTGTTFPTQYRNNFFWGDYNANKIYHTRVDASNNILGHETFVTGASGFVDISQGPDGALYYIGYVGGGVAAVRRIQSRAAARQDLVVSATNLAVREGTAASFTVKLAIAPAANVAVSIGRSVGDADVTASPASLTFTPANWSTAQTVAVSAAHDADASNDSATIACSSSGLSTKSVAVTVTDDDVPNGAPTALIIKPLNGDVVSGATAEFFGDGIDDVAPVRAQFFVDGVLQYTDTSPAIGTRGHYHYGGSHNRWDTTRYTNGQHTLKMTVVDAQGLTGSHQITVTVSNGALPVPASGLAFWAKGDGGVTLNGATVSQWADQSGNGRHATQGTAANQPTLVPNGLNGKPVVRFDGVGDHLGFNLPINGLTGMTVVMVSSCAADATGGTNGGANAALFWEETAQWGWTFLSPFQTGVKLRFGTTQTGNLPAYSRPSSIGSAYTTTISKHNGSTDSLFVNGSLVWSAGGKLSAIAGAVGTPWIGRGTGPSYFSGSIAEILVYSRAITDGERQTIEQYLNGKYFAAPPPPPPSGTGTGLRGEYFDNPDLTALKVTRTDATVNFDWGAGSPDATIGPDTFSCRWTGDVQPRYSQTYTFYAYTNDGVRLWVNNQLVINSWGDGLIERSGTIALTAGQRVAIRMEHYEGAGTALAKLSWSSSSQAKEIIPQSCLYPPAAGAALKPMVTLNGQGDYATIEEAAGAARPGDSVELEPSRYFLPTGLTLPPGVTLRGVAPHRTILDGRGADVVVRLTGTVAQGRSALQSLTVTGGVIGIDTGGADVLLKNIQVVKNSGDGIRVGADALVEGSSLTIADNGGDGIVIHSPQAAFRNIVVTGNQGTGISGPSEATVRFSTFFENGRGTAAGGINAEADGILLQPVAYQDAAALDYRERSESPTIDTGDPKDSADLEPSPNGGRINQGAFGNTPEAAVSAAAASSGGSTGGGCGLVGAEILLVLGWSARRRARRR